MTLGTLVRQLRASLVILDQTNLTYSNPTSVTRMTNKIWYAWCAIIQCQPSIVTRQFRQLLVSDNRSHWQFYSVCVRPSSVHQSPASASPHPTSSPVPLVNTGHRSSTEPWNLVPVVRESPADVARPPSACRVSAPTSHIARRQSVQQCVIALKIVWTPPLSIGIIIR